MKDGKIHFFVHDPLSDGVWISMPWSEWLKRIEDGLYGGNTE